MTDMTDMTNMTEKKKLREQMAVHRMHSPYSQPEPIQMRETPVEKREKASGYRERSQAHRPEMEARSLHRVVTVPQSDPSQAWNTFAHRQEQMRRQRSRPQRYVTSKPIARTYAQTGIHASSGRMRAVRQSVVQSLAQVHSAPQGSPIPTRSGRKSWLRNFWLRLVSLFAIIAVLILVANLMFTSGAFRIAQVNVEGTHNSGLISVIQRMGMQGQNIFLVNVEGLTAQIDNNPLVASATISKNWPNQLTVTITERVPVLLWQTLHGTYSVDAQGVVIAQASSVATNSLMTVVDTRTGKTGQGMQGTQGTQVVHPGTHLNASDIAFANSVFQNFPRMTGVTSFTLRYEVVADGAGTFVVQSSQGWRAYLGGANDPNPLDNRLVEVQQILQLAQQQQLTLATVDVRYGLYPVYTLASS